LSRLNENVDNLLGIVLVDTLDTLNLLAILEDDNSGKGLELQVVLAGWELVNVDLVGNGVVGVAASSSFGGLGEFTGKGVEEDVLVLGLESFHELLLAATWLVSWLLDGDLDGSWGEGRGWGHWSFDGGHCVGCWVANY